MRKPRLRLKEYQQIALSYCHKPARSAGLFLDMGLGKTAVTLTYLTQIFTDYPEQFRHALVIGPKRVIESTWPQEIGKWEQFANLTYSIASGTAQQRQNALFATQADIYLISRDNVPWLVDLYRDTKTPWPFDVVIIDELSSFKSPSSLRFKKLRKVLPAAAKVIGMTGTPAPNGLMDLWSQLLLLDNGKSLGPTITAYRRQYFDAQFKGQYVEYMPKPHAEEQIYDAIAPICMSMLQTDYLELPPLHFVDHVITPSPELHKQYLAFRKQMVMELPPEDKIVALTAASLANKLLQFCGGYAYDKSGSTLVLHQNKIDLTKQLVEEANGRPVIIYYAYQSERDALLAAFPGSQTLESASTIDRWNQGQIPVLIAHPASAGHGLNLQQGGNQVIWYNMTYSLELYQQANKRLHRLGQTKPVIVHRLITDKWVDQRIALEVLTQKATLQDAVMIELKAR